MCVAPNVAKEIPRPDRDESPITNVLYPRHLSTVKWAERFLPLTKLETFLVLAAIWLDYPII